MRHFAVWDTERQDWWISTKGHQVWNRKSSAVLAFNYEPSWYKIKAMWTPKGKLADQTRYVLKEVQLVPVETP